MDNPYDIVALGECLVDVLCEESGGVLRMEGNPGGAPANLLAMAARLGRSAALLAKVGEDRFGQYLLRHLQSAGIDVHGVLSGRVFPTTLAIVQLDRSGERSFSFYRDRTADVMLSAGEIDAAMLRRARIFHFGSLSLTDEPVRSATWSAVAAAKGGGALISFDPNWRPPLWHSRADAIAEMRKALSYADCVKVSAEELALITGKDTVSAGVEELFSLSPAALLAVTDGANGACLSNRRFSVSLPAFRVPTVDTTGAGDAFYGALLSALLETGKAPDALIAEELTTLLRFANAAGALSTTRKGGISAQPVREDITALVAAP